MPETLVTVLMPVYNAMPFLKSALTSIQKQTHRNLEILVIDDGSTDGSTAFLTAAAASDHRIHLVTRENRGLVHTLNQGLALASGDFVARMDADDIAYPDRLAVQSKAMVAAPEMVLSGMQADYLFGNRILRKPGAVVRSEAIKIELLFHAFFIHPTIMFNRRLLQAAQLGYDERYRHCEDFDLWRRASERHPMMLINRIGLAWRQNHASVRSTHFDEMMATSLGIVAEQLRRNGIASDAPSMSALIAQLATGVHSASDALVDHLSLLWRYGGFSAPDREAYENGLRALVETLMGLAARAGCSQAVYAACNQAGLAAVMPAKWRLEIVASRFIPNSTARRLVGIASRINRGLKGRKVRVMAAPGR